VAKDPLVIDGFASVQAVRRAGKNKQDPHFGSSRTRLPAASENAAPQKPTGPRGKIGHTVMPDTFEIVCYECGYTFTLRGKLRKTYCAKCRKTLVVDEQIIDSAWSGRVKTIGTVQVRDGGSLSKAHVVVGDLILDGHIEDSTVKICRRLELGSHASGDIAKIDTRDILIRRDAKVSYRSKLHCENFIVEGNFRGTIEVSGLVTVRAGAFLQGQVKAARLLLHEGGGLKATVKIAGTSKQ
jgi:cytoskeletal protein CcmA (bactofilin family)